MRTKESKVFNNGRDCITLVSIYKFIQCFGFFIITITLL